MEREGMRTHLNIIISLKERLSEQKNSVRKQRKKTDLRTAQTPMALYQHIETLANTFVVKLLFLYFLLSSLYSQTTFSMRKSIFIKS